MEPSAITRPVRRYFEWGAIALLMVAALAGRARWLDQPFRTDAGLYIYMGKVVATGGVLYHDIFETKYPGVALMTAGFWRAFGDWWPGYLLGQMLLLLGSSWLLARAMARSVGDDAFRPTFLALTVFLNFTWIVSTGFQLESLQAAFAMLAAVGAIAVLKSNDLRDTWLIGLAAGCAAMLKPTGIAVAGAFAITLLIHRRDLSIRRLLTHGLALGSGIAIPNLAVLFYTWQAGLLPDMARLTHEIKLYGRETPVDASLVLKGVHATLFLLIPIAIRSFLGRRDARPTELSPSTARRGLLIFAWAWLVIEAVGVLVQWRVYSYHLLVVAPAGAMLFGLLPRRDRLWPTFAALAPIALVSGAFSIPNLLHARQGLQPLPESQYIAANSMVGDAVYGHDIFRVLIETDRLPGSRYGHTFYFINYDEAPLVYGQGILQDLRERRPRYVRTSDRLDEALLEYSRESFLLTRPVRARNFYSAWGALRGFVQANYRPVAKCGGAIIWERQPTDSAGGEPVRGQTVAKIGDS